MSDTSQAFRVPRDELERFMLAVLARAGADAMSAEAVTRALVTASRMGTDSHGLRLLPHYIHALQGGRIAGAPEMHFERRLPATGYLDAGDGFGHREGEYRVTRYQARRHGEDVALTAEGVDGRWPAAERVWRVVLVGEGSPAGARVVIGRGPSLRVPAATAAVPAGR